MIVLTDFQYQFETILSLLMLNDHWTFVIPNHQLHKKTSYSSSRRSIPTFAASKLFSRLKHENLHHTYWTVPIVPRIYEEMSGKSRCSAQKLANCCLFHKEWFIQKGNIRTLHTKQSGAMEKVKVKTNLEHIRFQGQSRLLFHQAVLLRWYDITKTLMVRHISSLKRRKLRVLHQILLVLH